MTKDNKTPNFAEQANDYVGTMSVNVSTERRAERMEAFLAGCEHGYRVGKAELNEELKWRRNIHWLTGEADELKERLEECEATLKWMLENQALTIFIEDEPQVLNFFAKARAYFAKHPQDGAKGDW